MAKKGDDCRDEPVGHEGGKNLSDKQEAIEQPLNPRIVDGLNNLYDGIVNDPIPDKIANILDQLREQERSLKTDESGADETDKDEEGAPSDD